jgi:hypothetical protein
MKLKQLEGCVLGTLRTPRAQRMNCSYNAHGGGKIDTVNKKLHQQV